MALQRNDEPPMNNTDNDEDELERIRYIFRCLCDVGIALKLCVFQAI